MQLAVIAIALKVAIDITAHKVMFQPSRHKASEIKKTQHVKPFWIGDIHCVLFNASKEPSTKDTIVLFSHGNAGWIGDMMDHPMLNYLGTVLLYDYRGYGASPGTPSEDGIKQDAIKVYEWLRSKTSKILLYGFSLGCVPTVAICNKYDCNVILHAPFLSASRIIGDHSCSWIGMCASFTMDNRIDGKSTRKGKAFIFHSKKDEIISFEHGQALAKQCNMTLVEIKGRHNNPVYTKKALTILESFLSGN